MSSLAAIAGRRKSVSRVTADDGSVYFHDEVTGESTWEKPEGAVVVDHDSTIEHAARKGVENGRRKSRLSEQMERLRKTRAGGWETCLDNSTGKLYYWHRESGKTQWSVPAPILEARLAAREENKETKGAEEIGSRVHRTSSKARGLWRRASLKVKAASAFRDKARPRRRNVMDEGTEAHETEGNEINIQVVEKPENTKKLIHAAMEGNFVFQMLPKRVVRSMVDAMGAYIIEAGVEVIKQGDKGDYFYVIETGECDVIIDNHNVATLSAGRSFGELALFYNCPRNASIVSKTDCYLWRIGRADFKSLMVNGAISDTSAAEEAIASIPFLQKLTKDQMGRVASHCVLEEFVKDQKIINKGDHGDKFYIIKSGMVKCKIDDVHPALFLGPKKFFGERALLRDQPRAAHVIAARPTECLSLTRHAFHVLLGPIHADLQKEYSGGGGATTTPVEVKQQAPARVFAPAEKEEKFNHHNIQLNELTMGPVLGEGTFGRVQLVTHARTSSKWALKIMMKGQIAEMGQTKATILEKDVMMKIRHPLCLRLEATFMSKNLLYMMLEIVHGGELFQLLADSQTGVVSPSDARFYSACVVDAFSYLHGQGVVYRDLKPENLLIDKAGYLKVIDYGFAKFLTESPYKTFTFCGTPEYFAPEMMAGQGYAHSVDTWGVGILIYEMLYGFTPFADFEDNDPRKTMRYIMKNEVSFPPDGIKNEQCENVIRGLLTKNADMRLGCDENGISEVKTHPLYNGFDWNQFYNMQMKSPWTPTLSGPDGVVETTEEYDTYDTYMRNVQKYKGSQKWCQGW